MAQLIVVAFKGDIFRAGEVLYKLSELNDEWAVDLEDAVAVYRDHAGQLHMDESYQMTTGQEAALGAFWGALIPALIALPFTAGASGVAVAGRCSCRGAGRQCCRCDWRRAGRQVVEGGVRYLRCVRDDGRRHDSTSRLGDFRTAAHGRPRESG